MLDGAELPIIKTGVPVRLDVVRCETGSFVPLGFWETQSFLRLTRLTGISSGGCQVRTDVGIVGVPLERAISGQDHREASEASVLKKSSGLSFQEAAGDV